MRQAISYQRWSTFKQSHGDSQRRQDALRDSWLQAHPTVLLNETIRDPGRSAYNGTHAKTGEFARLIAQVANGEIKSGTILLIEAFDRITRQPIDDAWEVWRNLLKAGIDIAVLDQARTFTKLDLERVESRIWVEIQFSRSHEESKRKAGWTRANWEACYLKWKETGQPIKLAPHPSWLQWDGKKWKFTTHAKTIKYIVRLALDNLGVYAIANRLNDEKVPTLTGKGYWTQSLVGNLLRSRTLIGEANILKRIIPGYYKPVISEDDFNRVRYGASQRLITGRGPRSPGVINLFSGLLFDAVSGRPMRVKDKGNGKKRIAADGGRTPSFPLPLLESQLITWIQDVDCETLIRGGATRNAELEAQEGKCLEVEKRLNDTKALFKEAPSKTLAEVIAELESERDSTLSLTQTLRVKMSPYSWIRVDENAREVLEELASLKGKPKLEARSRIKAAFAQLVERIDLGIEVHTREKRTAWTHITYRVPESNSVSYLRITTTEPIAHDILSFQYDEAITRLSQAKKSLAHQT